jgi:hypothetical protein
MNTGFVPTPPQNSPRFVIVDEYNRSSLLAGRVVGGVLYKVIGPSAEERIGGVTVSNVRQMINPFGGGTTRFFGTVTGSGVHGENMEIRFGKTGGPKTSLRTGNPWSGNQYYPGGGEPGGSRGNQYSPRFVIVDESNKASAFAGRSVGGMLYGHGGGPGPIGVTVSNIRSDKTSGIQLGEKPTFHGLVAGSGGHGEYTEVRFGKLGQQWSPATFPRPGPSRPKKTFFAR